MFTYITNNNFKHYLNSDIQLDTIDGYQTSVGTTWEDYKNGKFILLNQKQLDFKANNPSASVYEVFNMELNISEIPETIEPERTLESAKQELHNQVDEYIESLKVIALNEENVWFEDRSNIKMQIEAEASFNEENVTIYDTNDNGHTMSIPEANNVILQTEHQDTRVKSFARDLRSQIEEILSLEVADMININDYTHHAPEIPSINVNGYIPQQQSQEPQQKSYTVTYKTANCHADNDFYEVEAGGAWKTTVYPDEGLALYIPDFVAEMGGQQLKIVFNDDTLNRPDYASSAYIYVENVIADILVAGIAH